MESMDIVRERIETLEQPMKVIGAHTHTVERRLRWWRGITCGLGLLALVSLAPLSQAADFTCTAGDVVCLIRSINQANSTVEADTITLEAGTYTLTAVDNSDTDGPNGLPLIISTLTLRGAAPDTTIIERAASAPAFRLLHIAASGTLTLEGLTVQGARCGGLDVRVECEGGGLLNQGTLTLRHSVFRNNGVQDAAGGGLLNTGTATLTHCLFTGNGSDNRSGGAIANRGTMTIHHCTVARNAASDGSGGGIANGGTLLLTDSAVTGNLAVENGGGIFNSGILTVINSTIANGGGSFIGGGLANVGSATLLNSTVVDNTSTLGGTGAGVSNGVVAFGPQPPRGSVVLLNTLLARNTRPRPPRESDCLGEITSLGHNLVGDPTGCTITLQPSDLTGDPGLGPFTDNGRPGNGHFPLLPTSQAIDAGNDAACPRTDQLGRLRIGPCDIGAIEFRHRDNRQDDEEEDHHDKDRAAAAQ